MKELESKRFKTKDDTWNGFDKLMRDTATDESSESTQLHDDFKAENDGLKSDE